MPLQLEARIKHWLQLAKKVQLRPMLSKYPRGVYFVDGKAVCSSPELPPFGATLKVMDIPSDHYDFFGPIQFRGLTELQILEQAEKLMVEQRLEYLRGELRAERIGYGELLELQSLAPHIQPGDVELLEAAGVPEHSET